MKRLQLLTGMGPTHLQAVGIDVHSVDPISYCVYDYLVIASIHVGFQYVFFSCDEHDPVQ